MEGIKIKYEKKISTSQNVLQFRFFKHPPLPLINILVKFSPLTRVHRSIHPAIVGHVHEDRCHRVKVGRCSQVTQPISLWTWAQFAPCRLCRHHVLETNVL